MRHQAKKPGIPGDERMIRRVGIPPEMSLPVLTLIRIAERFGKAAQLQATSSS